MYTKRSKSFIIAVVLAVTAGIVYNSWPLGYVLNSAVTHSHGLASELEALHQPFNWLFITLDTVCGVCVALAAFLLWRSNRGGNVTYKLIILSFALFGILTIADALLPMTCEPSLSVCPSLGHQPVLIMHGIASIGSGVALFVSAALAWRQIHTKSHIMNFLLAGWGLSGLLTLYFFFRPGPGFIAQDYYLILCGIWIALLPCVVGRSTAPKSSR